MYQVIFLPQSEKSFKALAPNIRKRIAEKIEWLSTNADTVIHHQLSGLPDDLKGLCRLRVGDYRVIYWIYHSAKTIKIYEIEHRSKDYRSVR
ncbi:MAG: type II toxin-antitoxin system RelE/ParE family toxin [Planctomycetota bacterium]|nr:type II toxin-antitoxin system RelE/ParE family toxin [Planctomycetota bacterium]MDI6788649.1 type II toxin-antitoxin system RelE/ParE family toxin [Planctomycetota bacterium]